MNCITFPPCNLFEPIKESFSHSGSRQISPEIRKHRHSFMKHSFKNKKIEKNLKIFFYVLIKEKENGRTQQFDNRNQQE